jgi:hypothetical protein
MYVIQGSTKENTAASPFENIHSSVKSNTCSNNQTKFLRSNKSRARATHEPISSAKQQYKELKNMMKILF